jgi:hypothetical protein
MKNYRFLKLFTLIFCLAFILSDCANGPLTTGIPTTMHPQKPSRRVYSPPISTSNPSAVATGLAPADTTPAAIPLATTSDPQEGLLHDLALANQEINATCQSTTLADAKSHAEAVVNIVGGPWGLWYGDANGDGQTNDPSDRQGLLPAGTVQSSVNSDNAHIQLGWALVNYEQGNEQAKKHSQALLGDLSLWMNDPFTAWKNVADAVNGTDLQHLQAAKLLGTIVRQMAWARLVLVKAKSLQDAHFFACQSIE